MKKVVVGDKFEAFARNEAVVCVREIESWLEHGLGQEDVLFELGQGIGAPRIEALLRLASAKGRRHQFLFDAVPRCGVSEVHKVRPENSVLSMPVQRDSSVFEAELLLDEECELFNDHVGGMHLPGMIFVEAVRQMGLAVIELHLTKDFPNKCAFLWTAIDIQFRQFAFPVKTTVVSRLQERKIIKPRREALSFDFECWQRGSIVVTSRSSVELHDRRVVERQEKGLAAAASSATAMLQARP